MTTPNVLQYARHFGLAIDSTILFRQQRNLIIKQLSRRIEDENKELSQEDITLSLSIIAKDIPDLISEETIYPSPEQSKILEKLNTASVFKLQPNSIEWHNILPEYKHIRKLYIEEPLVYIGGGNILRDIQHLRQHLDPKHAVNMFLDDWEAELPPEEITQHSDEESWARQIRTINYRTKNVPMEEKIEAHGKTLAILAEIQQPECLKQAIYRTMREEVWPPKRLWMDSSPLILTMDDYADDKNAEESGENPVSLSQSSAMSSVSVNESDGMHAGGKLTLVNHLADDNHGNHLKSEVLLDAASDLSAIPSSFIEIEPQHNHRSDDSRNFQKRKSCKLEVQALLSSKKNHQALCPVQRSFSTNRASKVTDIKTMGAASDLLFKLEADIDCQIADTDQVRPSDENDIEPFNLTYDTTKIIERSKIGSLCKDGFPTKIKLSEIEAGLNEVGLARSLHLNTALDGYISTLNSDGSQENGSTESSFQIPPCYIQADDIDGGTEYFENIVEDVKRPIDCKNLVWKPPGIRLLQNLLDFAEDLEEHTSSGDDTSPERNKTLANLAHRSSVADPPQLAPEPQPSCTKDGSNDHTSMISPRHKPYPTSTGYDADVTSIFKPIFSASSSLSMFLDLKGKRFSRPKNCQLRAGIELENDPIESTQQCNNLDVAVDSFPYSVTSSKVESSPILPLHKIIRWKRTIVMNCELMQSHPALLSFCEISGGELLKIIYRDFDVATQMHPDIILSPQACLIISSLQSLSQRSLPGQQHSRSLSITHQKVIQLAHIFEKVSVLVNLPDTAPRDASTMTKLTAFFSAVSTRTLAKIQPIWIPYSTTEGLRESTNAWIWRLICEQAVPAAVTDDTSNQGDAVSFDQDETTWERFLCYAGMNVMTAQIALHILKDVEFQHWIERLRFGQKSLSGLMCFVRMNMEQRLKLLDSVVGAHIIERVSLALEDTHE